MPGVPPSSESVSAGPAGGPPDGTLDAARSVLATLAAGRAALLHLAATHLPFDRLIALHHGSLPDVVLHDDLGGLIDRRLALYRRPTFGAEVALPTRSTVAPLPAAHPTPVASGIHAPVVDAPVVAAPVVAAPVLPQPAAAPRVAVPDLSGPVALPAASAALPGPERMARALLFNRPPTASGPAPATPPAAPPRDVATDALRDLATAASRPTPPVEPPPRRPQPPVEPPPQPTPAPVEEPTSPAPPVEAPPVSPPPTTPPPPVRAVAPPPALPSLDELLATPVDADATILAALMPSAPPPAPADDLSAWAASALGEEPRPVSRRAARPSGDAERAAEATRAEAARTEAARAAEAARTEAARAAEAARATERPRALPTGRAGAAPPSSDEIRVPDGARFLGLSAPESLPLLDPEEPHEHSVLDFGKPAFPPAQVRIGGTPAAHIAIEDDDAEIEGEEPSQAAMPPARPSPDAGRVGVLLGARVPTVTPARVYDDATDLPAGEETGDDIQAGTGHTVRGSLSVMRDNHAAPRSAPRLTDDDPSDHTQPAAVAPPAREPSVPDEKYVQELLAEGHDHARRGDFQKAIQLYTDALDMRYNLVDAHIGRGRCHLELGDYSSAMSDFARAEDHAPDRPDSHVAMGDLYFARKEYKRAIEFYDQAVEIDGGHAMARCRRGISHYYRKNYRQAHQDLQRALALDPEIPNIRKYVQMAQKKLESGEK